MAQPPKLKNSGMSGAFVSPVNRKSPEILFDLERGFNSMAGFFTAVLVNDKIGPAQLTIANLESQGIKPVSFCTDVERSYGKFNAEQFEVDLVELGFVKSTSSAGTIYFVDFDEKWLPRAQIEISAEFVADDFEMPYFRRYSYIGCGQHLPDLNRLVRAHLAEAPKVYTNFATVSGIADYGRFAYADRTILDETTMTGMNFALPEFYPWIKISLKEYFDEFFDSSANVLVLIGPPGTGKSTLLRTGIRDANANAIVVYKNDVLEHPEFFNCCRSYLETANSFHSKSARRHDKYKDYRLTELGSQLPTRHAVVIEDADVLMAKRTSGNPVMSEILNITDGLVTKRGTKFIFSTNLDDIDSVDPALLRPGRCFDILQFGPLTADQARKIRRLKNLPETGIEDGRKYKLSEVLNNVSVEKRTEPIIKPRFGFA